MASGSLLWIPMDAYTVENSFEHDFMDCSNLVGGFWKYRCLTLFERRTIQTLGICGNDVSDLHSVNNVLDLDSILAQGTMSG